MDILDLWYPGYEKYLEMNPAAKVIACSAIGQPDVVLGAIKAGARDYIVKPFTQESIAQAASKVLGQITF